MAESCTSALILFEVRLFTIGLLLFSASLSVSAQVLDATHLGDSIDLSGDWRFQPGDDMRWAQPDFDDSHWRVISTLKRWNDQQVTRPRDLFWYRLHVKLPPEHGPLSLLFNYSGL